MFTPRAGHLSTMAAETEVPDVAVIELTGLTVGPNDVPLDNPLELTIEFTTDRDIDAAYWEVWYIADHSNKRKEVSLGQTEPEDFKAGAECKSEFSMNGIDTSAIKKKYLKNMGLLSAVLKQSDGSDIITVSMVTQVLESDGGELVRNIMSPLE